MDIVDRLKEQAVGREEWRIANPDDGSYVISFSWGDTLSPERDAREWLADHLTRNPTSWVAGYEVRKVIAQGDTDMLMIDAANEIARLSDEHASLSAQLIAFQTAWPGGVGEVSSVIGSLRDENAKLLAERDDADRRAGNAERTRERDRDDAYARDSWLRRAKEQWGVGPTVSFDVVWGEALELKNDAERLDWLERETHKSSYAVQFRLLRDPAINAGMNRVECATSVGAGPWQRAVEGATLRAAIDAAMQKGER